MPDRRRRRARQRTEQSKEKLHSPSPPSLLLPSFIFPHEVTSPIHPSISGKGRYEIEERYISDIRTRGHFEVQRFQEKGGSPNE